MKRSHSGSVVREAPNESQELDRSTLESLTKEDLINKYNLIDDCFAFIFWTGKGMTFWIFKEPKKLY